MNFDQLKHAAHVWLAQPELINDSTLLSHYRAILSPQELQQCDRFYFEHDRHHYLVAHALLRTVLSFYPDASPQDYVFNKNDYGRPELAEGNWPKSLRFNISHTRGLVACIVTDTIDCGVDVEGIRELSD